MSNILSHDLKNERQLLLKVCGMKYATNINELVAISPDFMGFIFYNKSPRYVKISDEKILDSIPKRIKKVGVFVNESIEKINNIVKTYALDYVQLHGDESVKEAIELKNNGINVIKVFRLKDQFPNDIEEYQGVVDYFLFDTHSSTYGGAGKHFNWNLLLNYTLETPFLLSGGIGIEDIPTIRNIINPNLIGIDVNSKFEIEPGLKNIPEINSLKMMLKV